MEVASDVSSTVVVSRNVAITSETYTDVNVIIWRTDDVVDVVILVEFAAGGGMQSRDDYFWKAGREGRNASYGYDLELAGDPERMML